MDDLIDRQDAIDVLHRYFDGMLDTDTVCPSDIYGLFECIPTAQPDFDTDQKMNKAYDDGYDQGYAQCKVDYHVTRYIKEDDITEMLDNAFIVSDGENCGYCIEDVQVSRLPSAQPEIILCKDCKHWTQSMGKMKGYGLGRCDFHDADLVACNGFCYWAERRTDE